MGKKNVITFIVLGVIFVGIFIFVYISGKDNRDKGNTEFPNLTIVTDENMYFSVSNNLSKIFNYSEDKLKYIVKNEINYNDYMDVSFVVEEEKVISHLNLYKYYVKGSIYTDYNGIPNTFIREGYYVLNYCKDNNTFNIEIIDKDIYDNASNIERVFEIIDKNDYNSFEYDTISDKSRAIMYFEDFKSKLKNNINDVYNIISSDTKDKYFNDIDSFREYFNNISSMDMISYSVNENIIGVKDNNDIEYIFSIYGILRYKIEIIKPTL